MSKHLYDRCDTVRLRCDFHHTHFLTHSTVIITDPNAEEESLSTDQVTVAVSEGELCLVHKPGGAALAAEQLEACVRQALEREKKVVALLGAVLKSK